MSTQPCIPPGSLNRVPNYIQDLCVPVSSVSTRVALRSAARGDLVVPRTRLRLGNLAFSVAGPAVWNSLPTDIRSAPTLCTFKNRLKTHLFLQSYILYFEFHQLNSSSVCCTAPLYLYSDFIRTCYGAI